MDTAGGLNFPFSFLLTVLTIGVVIAAHGQNNVNCRSVSRGFGETGNITCKIKNMYQRNVVYIKWHKIGEDGKRRGVYTYSYKHENGIAHSDVSELYQRVSFEEDTTAGRISLIFQNTAVNDSGLYICEIVFSWGAEEGSVDYNVLWTVVESFTCESQLVHEGEGAQLECMIKPENATLYNASWYQVLDNKESEINTKSPGSPVQTTDGRIRLFIKNTSKLDSGTYSCIIFTPTNSIRQQLNLFVLGKNNVETIFAIFPITGPLLGNKAHERCPRLANQTNNWSSAYWEEVNNTLAGEMAEHQWQSAWFIYHDNDTVSDRCQCVSRNSQNITIYSKSCNEPHHALCLVKHSSFNRRRRGQHICSQCNNGGDCSLVVLRSVIISLIVLSMFVLSIIYIALLQKRLRAITDHRPCGTAEQQHLNDPNA